MSTHGLTQLGASVAIDHPPTQLHPYGKNTFPELYLIQNNMATLTGVQSVCWLQNKICKLQRQVVCTKYLLIASLEPLSQSTFPFSPLKNPVEVPMIRDYPVDQLVSSNATTQIKCLGVFRGALEFRELRHY